MSKTIVAGLVVGACMAGSFALLGSVNAQAAGCSTYANTPYKSGGSAVAVGGKSGSCSASHFRVSLFHKTWRWDDEVSKQDAYDVGAVRLETYGKASGGWELYTKAQDFSGATHLSGTMTF